MAKLFRASIHIALLVFLLVIVVVSVFPIEMRRLIGGNRLLGLNLMENYSANVYERKFKELLRNVYYFFPYAPGYNLRKSLSKIVQLGGNTVVFGPAIWTDNRKSTVLEFDAERRGPLLEAMKEAKSRGLTVILRPIVHIMAIETNVDWRGVIEPINVKGNLDWDEWFESYKKASEFYLAVALEADADAFVVGVELVSSLQDASHWNKLVPYLKDQAKAAGKHIKFSYDTLYPSEFEQIYTQIQSGNREYVKFFASLDHLGINFYPPMLALEEYVDRRGKLRKNIAAHVTYLNNAFEFMNSSAKELENLAHIVPAMVTEFGIKSAKRAATHPWQHPFDGDVIDYEEQSEVLDAGLIEFNTSPWISGVLIWNTYMDPYYGIANFIGRIGKKNGENTFAITGKPAERVVRSQFFRIQGASWMHWLQIFLFWIYIVAAFVISVFGLHRLLLVFKARRSSLKVTPLADYPYVTIQAPIYNESQVVPILLRHLQLIDYPVDRLEIQILDDSTDDTPEVVAEYLKQNSFKCAVHHIRRGDRKDFKAGALAHGLSSARGEFIAIFDADFRPTPDFLKSLLPYFSDESVGLVQAKWHFLNKCVSNLTRVQSLFLGGHFNIEHVARHNSGCYFNFNGTAGIFRRKCIDDSGGWQSYSLTEDLDLSYRAQLRGWKFIPAMNYSVPSELPEKMLFFKRQQHRWVKGSAQVLKRIFPIIASSGIPLKVKREALFHLAGNSLYLFVLILAVSLLSVLNARLTYDLKYSLLIDLPMLIAGSFVMFVFYFQALKNEESSKLKLIVDTFFGMVVGVGMCVNNSLALIEGFLGLESAFVRTPKKGLDRGYRGETGHYLNRVGKLLPDISIVLMEWILAVYSLHTLRVSIQFDLISSMAFSSLFFIGLTYVAALTTIELFVKVFRAE